MVLLPTFEALFFTSFEGADETFERIFAEQKSFRRSTMVLLLDGPFHGRLRAMVLAKKKLSLARTNRLLPFQSGGVPSSART